MTEVYPNVDAARFERNVLIAKHYGEGRPLAEISAASGCTYAMIRSIAFAHGVKRPLGICRMRNPERNLAICAEYLGGKSLEEVGTAYSMTRERVRQILVKHGHEERHNGFNSERRAAFRERAFPEMLAREEKKERRAAQIALARELYNAGETYAAIAERLSHPITWVQNAIWTTGGPSRNRRARKPRRVLSDTEKTIIAAHYARGENVRVIGDRFDLSPEYVRILSLKMGARRP